MPPALPLNTSNGANAAQGFAGPHSGLRTGDFSAASDNDPTAVASLAVIGSTTTYGLGGPVPLEYLQQIP